LFDLGQPLTVCFTRGFVVDKERFMWFLALGLLLLLLKTQGLTLVAAWPWWAVLVPFGLAAAWWSWADYSGYSKRQAVEKENRRVKARVDRQRQAMGLPPKRK
jgi:small Trp-rich protein